MPNGGTHIIAGAVCGALASTVIQKKLEPDKTIEFDQLLLSTGTGGLCGRVPDVLEPASNPNHRDFFHSFTCAAILGFGGAELWSNIKERKTQRMQLGIQEISGAEILLMLGLVAVLAILLHLFMDGFTQKGLPII